MVRLLEPIAQGLRSGGGADEIDLSGWGDPFRTLNLTMGGSAVSISGR